MSFRLVFTDQARQNLRSLAREPGLAKRLKAVRQALAHLESNPRHPGLHTHQFRSLSGSRGEKIYEAYAEQATPAAYRLFWCYGPDRDEITILAITPHP